MVDYAAALKRPFQEPKRLFLVSLILLGYFIVAFIFLAVFYFFTPNILRSILTIFVFAFPLAYFIKAGLSPLKKGYKMPSWPGFGDLFKNGLKLGVVNTILAIPFWIVLYLIAVSILGASLVSDYRELYNAPFEEIITPGFQERKDAIYSQILTKLPVLLPLYFIVIFMFMLILKVAEFRLIETQEFKPAFQLPAIFKIAFSLKFIIALIVSSIALVILMIIAMLVAFILFITAAGIMLPYVLSIFLYIAVIILVPYAFSIFLYIAYTITFSLLGQAYSELKIK